MAKKKIKDLTLGELKAICLKARTNKKGKVKDWCNEECPLYGGNGAQLLFQNNIRTCEILHRLNQEIEVENENN